MILFMMSSKFHHYSVHCKRVSTVDIHMFKTDLNRDE